MGADSPQKKTVKQKVVHEFEEVAILTAYLAFFFCALATYSMLLLGKFHISYFAYGTALINALVIAKVILIGDTLHAGTRYERKALLHSAMLASAAAVISCCVSNLLVSGLIGS